MYIKYKNTTISKTLLESKHNAISDIIRNQPIQYIDIPMYTNIGDHLIAHGTFTFFKEKKIPILSAHGINQYKDNYINESNILVFGGGGNFGDLWDDIHIARLNIIKKTINKNKIIIILPQTIFYKNKSNLLRDIDTLKEYPHLFLFTRDTESFKVAKQISQNVFLAPDMAHHLSEKFESITNANSSVKKELFLLRKDKESIKKIITITNNELFDWDDVISSSQHLRAFKNYVKWYKRLYQFSFDKKLERWQEKSWNLISSTVEVISKYDTITTDRLHASILALMLKKKVNIIDNNYNKISNYYKEWFNTP